MNNAEFLDMAFRVYQVMGWTILRLAFVPSLFCLAAVTFFFRYVYPAYFETTHPDSIGGQVVEVAIATGLAVFVAAPLFLVGVSYMSIAATQLVSEFMIGDAPSPAAAASQARKKLMSVFWLNVREMLISSGGILISLGLLALSAYVSTVTSESDASAGLLVILAWFGFAAGLVMFLFVQSWHAIAPQVMTLENAERGSAKAATRRSKQLLKAMNNHGSGFGAIWVLYCLLFLLFLFIGAGISGCLSLAGFPENIRGMIASWPFAPVILELVSLLPTFLVIWTLVPLWAIATTIIYYDRRIRLEGYDIEALAEDVWRADRSRRFEL